MIQAVLLMATVLGASIFYWNHNRDLAIVKVRDSDVLLRRHEFHPILWNHCRWPNLDNEEEDIKKYLKGKRTSECSMEFSANIRDGVLQVSSAQNVMCSVSDLGERIEKLDVDLLKNMENYTDFVLECGKNGQTIGRRSLFNYEKLKMSEDSAKATPKKPSLSVLYLKSMSRAHFQRNFPEFQKTLKKYQMHEFAMFNKISNNISETVFRTYNLNNVGIDKFMRSRYCNVFTNDEARSGIRSDFSLRKFEEILKADSCRKMDSMHESLEWIKVWAEFEVRNTKSCHFSHVFVDNPIEHQDYRMDTLLSETFRKFAENQVLNNTIILILSAEGIPIGEFGNSYTGKIEERQPILLMNVPNRLQKLRRDHSFHLDKNQNSLITHRDVFETLDSFTKVSETQKIVELSAEEWSRKVSEDRGISVWQSLMPLHMTCTHSKIPDEHCLCMEHQLEIEKEYNRTNEMLDRINEKMSYDIVNQHPYSCISSMYIDPYQNFTAVYNLNAKILANTDPYVQFLYVRNRASDSTNTARNRFFSALGQFKQYIYEDDYRIETSYPYCMADGGFYCFAGLLDRFCEMCHDTLLLSY